MEETDTSVVRVLRITLVPTALASWFKTLSHTLGNMDRDVKTALLAFGAGAVVAAGVQNQWSVSRVCIAHYSVRVFARARNHY